MAENFNWVKKRFHCSLGEVFEQLKNEVRQDVAAREELRPKTPEHSRYAFKFSSSDRTFTAWLDGDRLHKTVEFRLEDKAISVLADGKAIWSATVTLDKEGHCVLQINGEECGNWQARKLALEPVFFAPEIEPDFFTGFGGRRA